MQPMSGMNFGGNPSGLTYSELKDRINRGSLPNFFGALAGADRNFLGWFDPDLVTTYEVEVSQMFFGGETNFSLHFVQDGIKVGIVVKGREVTDRLTGKHRWVVGEIVTTSNVRLANAGSGIPAHTVGGRSSVQRVTFNVSKEKNQFVCREKHPYNNLDMCDHIEKFINEGRDAPMMMSWLLTGALVMTISVPVASNLFQVPVVLSSHTQDEMLGNGSDKSMLKYTIDDDFYVWPDMDAPSLKSLMAQFVGAIQNSESFQNWVTYSQLAHAGSVSTSNLIPCPNKHHSKMDTENFKKCIREASRYGALYSVALANAVCEYLHGRCVSCFQVRERMANDVPKL